MRSTLQAKNAKTCKYFLALSGLSPPDLNPMISNPSRNSSINSLQISDQILGGHGEVQNGAVLSRIIAHVSF